MKTGFPATTPRFRFSGRPTTVSAPADFVLTLWTDNPELARRADIAGVDRIGPDLESHGKARRQHGMGTWITTHRVECLPKVKQALTRAALFVRTNPVHDKSREEVAQLLDLGASVLMLPNFTSVQEIETFLRLVDGRARVVPLLERLAAAREIERIVAVSEVDEIHIGMNDLSIDLGLTNRLAVLTSDVLADVATVARASGVRLGVGGIARALDENLPVPSDLVYAQFPRLGARAAMISRSFGIDRLTPDQLCREVAEAKARMAYWYSRDAADIERSFHGLRSHFRDQLRV